MSEEKFTVNSFFEAKLFPSKKRQLNNFDGENDIEENFEYGGYIEGGLS